jgi:hypothetical protein
MATSTPIIATGSVHTIIRLFRSQVICVRVWNGGLIINAGPKLNVNRLAGSYRWKGDS